MMKKSINESVRFRVWTDTGDSVRYRVIYTTSDSIKLSVFRFIKNSLKIDFRMETVMRNHLYELTKEINDNNSNE